MRKRIRKAKAAYSAALQGPRHPERARRNSHCFSGFAPASWQASEASLATANGCQNRLEATDENHARSEENRPPHAQTTVHNATACHDRSCPDLACGLGLEDISNAIHRQRAERAESADSLR